MTTTQGRHVADQAWVTLATNDTYALGALVLAHSLIRVSTSRKISILVTPGVSDAMRSHLSQVFDHVIQVNIMDSSDAANLALLTRPDLGVTFTKLHCWRLTQFNKCVFLDADTLVMQNCDELFEREEFSAAPDVGWPDCFNSGVFVYRPSNETYASLVQCALTTGSFDGGDQGLLNVYFRDWATKDIAKHLPFVYNMTSSVAYSYLPAYLHFGKDVKIVHFIGPVKPWHHNFNTATGLVDQHPGAFHSLDHLQIWWNIFAQDVHPNLQPELAGLAVYLSQLSIGAILTPEQKSQEDRARQFAWEQGHIDYMGADAFANIQRKLDESLVPPTADGAQPESQSIVSGSELKSVSTEATLAQNIAESSITTAEPEPVSIVSCPLAVPITPVHRSSVHLSDPIQLKDDKSGADAASAAEPQPASAIPASTRMEIIPAIPRTPPIVPSTPIMLPPPPGMCVAPPTQTATASATPTTHATPIGPTTPPAPATQPPAAPPVQATPTTPSITPATPGTPPAPPTTLAESSPIPPPVIPPPVTSIPSTPPAATSVPSSVKTSSSAALEKVTSQEKPTTTPAISEAPKTDVPPPPLPPRAPVPSPEVAGTQSTKPTSGAIPQPSSEASAGGATGGDVAQKSGGVKKQQQQQSTEKQPKAAATAPSAPVRKGDKGKPSKK